MKRRIIPRAQLLGSPLLGATLLLGCPTVIVNDTGQTGADRESRDLVSPDPGAARDGSLQDPGLPRDVLEIPDRLPNLADRPSPTEASLPPDVRTVPDTAHERAMDIANADLVALDHANADLVAPDRPAIPDGGSRDVHTAPDLPPPDVATSFPQCLNPVHTALSRPNPLRSYFEASYSGNGGSNFPHIKLYGILFNTIIDDDERAWIARHYDVYVHGGWDLPPVARTMNPKLLTVTTHNMQWMNTSGGTEAIEAWATDNGYILDDLVLNYALDTTLSFNGRLIKGWNPDDDQGQCGGTAGDGINDLVAHCASGPSDPERTAPTIAASRVPHPEHADWLVNDPVGPAWRAWATDRYVAAAFPGNDLERQGFRYDSLTVWVPAAEHQYLQTHRTFPYLGATYDQSFPQIEDTLASVAHLTALTEAEIGPRDIHIGNIGSTWAACGSPGTRLPLVKRYLENVEDETWLRYKLGTFNYDDNYQRSFLCPLNEFLRCGYGYVFSTPDPDGTIDGKLFTLAAFYLVNHPMALYYYMANDNHWDTTGRFPSEWQWNELVEFDVGQPAVNAFGIADFEGNHGTTEHFELATGEDPAAPGKSYHILGRQYDHALVLVKLMGKGSTQLAPASATTHMLGASYRPLMPDGGPGDPTDRITLRNNEGAILIPAP